MALVQSAAVDFFLASDIFLASTPPQMSRVLLR